MENKQKLKEKDIQKKLLIGISLATIAVILTLFKLSFNFIIALVAYIWVAIAVVKKDGAIGILQVILVFPAIFQGVKNFFNGENYDDTDTDTPRRIERLANFALFYSATIILFTIVFPVVRFIWNIFT